MNFKRKTGSHGFTLIEMMVVISLILILLSIALPMYNRSIQNARETVFRSNLATLNKVISQYTLDKNKAPLTLDDLVQAKYLKSVPPDITGSPDTWVPEMEDSLQAVDQSQPGMVGVHSGSDQIGSNGTAYSTW